MKPTKLGDPIRLLLAESSQTRCELLTRAFCHRPDLNVSSCPLKPTDCLASLEAEKADLLLVGLGVSKNFCSVLDVVRTVRSSFPSLPIVVLLNASDREIVVTLLRAGVRGLFCFYSQSFKALCKCIRAVHEGQFWTNTEQMSFAMQALTETPPVSVVDANGNALLTPRENQVVGLVAEGLSNRAAARQLKISENSIKKSLLRIYDKLGISNRVELVLYAMNRATNRLAAEPHKQKSSKDAASVAVLRPADMSVFVKSEAA